MNQIVIPSKVYYDGGSVDCEIEFHLSNPMSTCVIRNLTTKGLVSFGHSLRKGDDEYRRSVGMEMALKSALTREDGTYGKWVKSKELRVQFWEAVLPIIQVLREKEKAEEEKRIAKEENELRKLMIEFNRYMREITRYSIQQWIPFRKLSNPEAIKVEIVE